MNANILVILLAMAREFLHDLASVVVTITHREFGTHTLTVYRES